MVWTYTPSALATSAMDQVRLLVGDTDPNEQQLQDEEINYLISIESGTTYAAARCAEAIAALYARKVTTEVGDLKIWAETKSKHYRDLAASIRSRAGITDCAPYAGGISIADKENQENDTDRVSPLFTRNDARNPRAGYPYPTSSRQWYG